MNQGMHQNVIDAGEQLELQPEASINLMGWRDPTVDRAIMLWMEPRTKADARSLN